jgi:hypothetical protein
MKKAALVTATIALAITGASLMSSCSKSDSSSPKTLYDTLGGTAMVADPSNSGTQIEAGRLAIRSVVDSAIFVVAGDAKLQPYFTILLAEVGSNNLTGFTALSKNFTDFVCVATGSKNFTYGGKSMTAAHDPAQNSRMAMKADSTDFALFVTDVAAGAAKCNVPTAIINRLGTILYSVEWSVVQK